MISICHYLYYILSTQIIGLISCPHSIQPGNKIGNCALPLTHEGVSTTCGFQVYSLVLQTGPFPFHSTTGFHYQLHTESRKARGSHLYVACWSICNWDQDFWLAKSVLDWLIVPSKALDHLIFLWVKGQIAAVHSWSFDCCSLEVTLIPWSALKEGFDHLIPSCKCFYTDHTSGYTPRKGLI